MPRKSRKKAQPESPVTDPVSVAEVLRESPIAQIVASNEGKAPTESDKPVAESEGSEAVAAFLRQREREQAVAEPAEVSHVARLQKMQPVPEGFRDASTFSAAGIRVNKSLDRKTVAIQFDEERRASRDGLNSEVELLATSGFSYEPLRRQWERHDRERPGVNIVDAQRFGAELAARRTGREL